MKSVTRGTVKSAVKSLRSNRWRTFLTMLGIIIGVASVITVVSLGQGIKQQVAQQIDHLGKDLLTVRAGQVTDTSLSSLNSLTGVGSTGVLSLKDYQAVKTASGVSLAVPLGSVDGKVSAERGTYRDGPVIATSADLPNILRQKLAYGGFFDNDDDVSQNQVAILGQHAAQAMFNEAVPLGRTFIFRGQQFMVRGVFDAFTSAPLSPDVNFNNAIFIPTSTAQALTRGTNSLYEVLARPTDANQTDRTVASIKQKLLQLHGDAHDFSVLKPDQSAVETNQILNLLTDLVAAVAAVSLLVGGIGIMNIMLVAVTERMHEIGIRKAIGATNRQILNEFMTEALVLSITGGVIGVLVSLVIDLGLRLFTSLTPVINWQIVLLAAGISIVIGILFGTAPALKAARKDPIAALRNE